MASFTVTCKAIVVAPSSGADEGLATNVLVALAAGPATKVTAASIVLLENVTDAFLAWAKVELKVAEHAPELLVVHVLLGDSV